jgi:tetratricopeptide (TPR) repeat protein
MLGCMKIRKFAAIAVLVLGSVAADNVAPSKAELQTMYDKAFRAFDANNFPEALKELDAIDARQPDLAESQNLRGVILMREGIYDKAEAALNEALRIDPKFWNARFNLAEIPFLRKDWAEARKRFEEMLSSNAAELQGEATQLIQYKILLTYLLEGKENMVDSILAKFELSPDTPAVHYANAAIALQRNDAKEAKNWMVTAEKSFSPQLNKLFAESLYEIGWLQKQSGQTRAAMDLTSAAERTAKMKAFAQSRFEQAQQAMQQHDVTAARKFVDDADSAEPNQARTLNLRGEILTEQKEFDQAEAEFKKALKADPKFREAQYNLAQIPFKQKDYAKARDRFEALFSKTPGGDKNQAAQLIKFKIYMTLLLEGKESRAQKMMEQFQFTGDTPALYYAQAAWEFKHNNPTKAMDWITSAKKIYSPALNIVFADAFYDLGWMQSPSLATSPAPATEAAIAMESAQTESSPAIEPSPIPGASVAKKGTSKGVAEAAASPAIAGMEATTSHTGEPASALAFQAPANTTNEAFSAGTPVKPEEVPTAAAPNISPVVETPVAANASPASAAVSNEAPVVAESTPATEGAVSATPATVLAPSRVESQSQSQSKSSGGFDWQQLAAIAFILAAVGLVGWVAWEVYRRGGIHIPTFRRAVPANGIGGLGVPVVTAVQKSLKTAPRLSGGPRQISLKLKASEASLRRAVVPVSKVGRALTPVIEPVIERNGESHAEQVPVIPEPVFDSVGEVEQVGEVVEQGATATAIEPEAAEIPQASKWSMPATVEPEPPPMSPVEESWTMPAATVEPESIPMPSAEESWTMPTPVLAESEPAVVDLVEPVVSQAEGVIEPEIEPIGQGQPIPQLTPVMESEPYPAETIEPESQPIGLGELRQVVEPPPFVPQAVEPEIFQPITPVTMPEPTQTQTPVIRTSAGGAPGSMQTSVQLTFAFEIASMQLTPTFKMGAVQLRPSSKIVTMRLGPSQAPQPAMNLQVNFEISKIQPSGGALGNVRLTPSQQQRPAVTGTPSFTVAGLQLVSDFAAAPLQLTPSQQGGQTSVLVSAPFQIATVEFSPSFEIASIILNSNSKQVAVQLPGAASTDGAPMFEIANLQLTGTGDIGMMQLHLIGQGPRR